MSSIVAGFELSETTHWAEKLQVAEGCRKSWIRDRKCQNTE